MGSGFCWIETLMEAASVIALALIGAALVYLFPGTVLLYTIGAGFLFAAMGAAIDLIISPGEPPAMLPISILAAAGMLIGAW